MAPLLVHLLGLLAEIGHISGAWYQQGARQSEELTLIIHPAGENTERLIHLPCSSASRNAAEIKLQPLQIVPGKLTGIVRAHCNVAGTARGEDADIAAPASCTESSWMAAKHVTISYRALARVGDGSGSSLVNFETQGCADGNAVVLMSLTLPAVSLYAAMGISWLVLSKLICLLPSAECFCWQFARQSCMGSHRGTNGGLQLHRSSDLLVCVGVQWRH